MIAGLEISVFLWVAFSVFLLGVSKGGIPVASISLPILILIWPNQANSARDAVAFLLPLLCVMDVFAVVAYRKRIQWTRILPLLPGSIAGVALATLLFIPNQGTVLEISDRALKIAIGVLGLIFVAYRAFQKWILGRLSSAGAPTFGRATAFGTTAGLTSSLAHAASPVMQMYLLPQDLDRRDFAGTTAGYFFILNLVKVLPFAVLGRFQSTDGRLLLVLLPVIPLGVIAGYVTVQRMKTKHYIAFIYVVLFVTSVTLIMKAL